MQDEQGIIVLSRVRGGYRDVLRRYRVVLDGSDVGLIGRGERLRFEVPAGRHQLQLKIDWCASPLITTEVLQGQEVCFSCAPGGGPAEALQAATEDSQQYIELRQVPAGTVVLTPPLAPRAKLRLVCALVGFASMVSVLGAGLWHAADAASHTADVVIAAGLVGFLISAVATRLSRPR